MNTDVSLKQLKRAIKLRTKIEKMQAQLSALLGGSTPGPKAGKRRTMSASARAKIAAAQRKRWAKVKAAKG